MIRVFICGELNMPHGSSGANYIQHFAMGFRAMGVPVTIITNINAKSKNELQYIKTNGIKLQIFDISKNRFLHSIDYNYLLPVKIRAALERLNISKSDVIVAYSRRKDVLETILKFGKKKCARTVACIVEWYGREDVASDEEYTKSESVMENIFPKFDIVIPISRYIEDYYIKKGCKAIYLPCMTDINEFRLREKVYGEKKRFIYPANGKIKDALSEMLEAIIRQPEDILSQCEFNFCGVKEATAIELTEGRIQPLIDTRIVMFHKWMSYKELIGLYNKMHFLLLMRKTSRMTLANFPSKVPETMTYGVTPVCSKVGDYTKLYLRNKENAIVIGDTSIQGIISVIKLIAEMPWSEVRRLNKNSRQTAEENFDYRQWLDILKLL